MKKIGLFLAFMVAGVIMVNAQGGGGGGFRQRTVEERVKTVHEKIDSAFKLDAEKLTKVDAAFTTFYKGQDKVREELMSGGERPDRDAMMAKLAPVTEARDKELKAILTEEQFKKFKDEIEPALNPRRGPGGGGGNRQ
jgi:DNA-directed RNA polymerase subunit F